MAGSLFVVQEHFARTHHYDLRLEREGVLKSWVLRKSPPTSPGVRRLAIAVEDHDLGYGEFEGEIPKGEYGAGIVRLWDRGTYQASRWDPGHLSFHLLGSRLVGSYTLIRFPRGGPDQWLFFKHSD